MIRSAPPVVLAAAGLLLSGCNDRDNMRQGARLRSFEASPDSPALLATATLPDGVVARASESDPGTPPTRPALTLSLLHRGRALFDVYCAPCHARDGYGDGMIVRHGFPAPPSIHQRDIRTLTDGHSFAVITDGLGKMPAYGDMIREHDRWAVVEYVRALQLSQNAPAELVNRGSLP